MTLLWLVIISLLIAASAVLLLRTYVLTKRLKEEKLRNSDLNARAGTLESQQNRSQQILRHLDEGILVTDAGLAPKHANRAAREIFGWGQGPLPEELPSREMGPAIVRLLEDPGHAEEVLAYPYPRPSHLRLRAARIGNSEVVIFLSNVTEERRTARIRKEFVAHASHELKSPVASLQALAEAIGDALPEDQDAALRFLERMGSEAERLGKLLSDLLDLSRLEEATTVPSDHVDLTAVIMGEVRNARPLAVDKYMGLHTQVQDGLVVAGDAAQLGLMLRNLLLNAVAYTPRGGTVEVRAWAGDKEIMLEVADNGIGIPRDAQERVFERFYRVDSGRSRAEGGTGLGLAIVKHVVELHRGRIRLRSEPGKGTTFTVCLPSREESHRAERVSKALEE
jgi:signal transduction histidine kinase